MISPEEIKIQINKWWIPLLQSYIKNEPFFPKSVIRIRKVSGSEVTQRFDLLQEEIKLLHRGSKNTTGIGYFLKTTEQNFRRTGHHELPDTIIIEDIEDYLHITKRKKEWNLFVKHYHEIVQSIPVLKEWAFSHTSRLTHPNTEWDNILKVCHYFLVSPRPNLYLRQLPIEIHTKYIEDNTTLLQSLLDFLLPNHIRNSGQKKFAERYYLKYDEPIIRIRILDKRLSVINGITDISIPLSDFEKTNWPAENILVAENKMNFLALPDLFSTIAIWSGGGFQISYLKHADWLKTKNIYYWGDIDEHGFQLLHQIRSYYPKTKSVLMDNSDFTNFQRFTVDGPRNKSEKLHLLDEDENKQYHFLKSLERKNRLEQEKLSQQYVNKKLYQLINNEHHKFTDAQLDH